MFPLDISTCSCHTLSTTNKCCLLSVWERHSLVRQVNPQSLLKVLIPALLVLTSFDLQAYIFRPYTMVQWTDRLWPKCIFLLCKRDFLPRYPCQLRLHVSISKQFCWKYHDAIGWKLIHYFTGKREHFQHRLEGDNQIPSHKHVTAPWHTYSVFQGECEHMWHYVCVCFFMHLRGLTPLHSWGWAGRTWRLLHTAS